MLNQLSSTPKRMLGCVILGVFGFLTLMHFYIVTGSIIGAISCIGILMVIVLLFYLLCYCFE